MPLLELTNATIYYEEQGSGPETIVFAHGLLWSGRMFDDQVRALKAHYRCVTFDFRGQGQSEVTPTGYDMETLSADAAALITALGCAPCHFVGLSMGGFVGMRLASRQPHLIKSLMLLETTADPEQVGNVARYRLLNLIARWFSLRLVVNQVMPLMFGQKFLADPTRAELRQVMRQRIIQNHRIGITRAVTGVVERKGVYEEIRTIKVPTLIVVGDQDVATVPAKSQRIQAQIAGSRLVIIPGAGHTATVEEPTAINQALLAFLAEQTSTA